MFYSQCLLSGKGPLGAIWVAAYFFKKLKKAQVTGTDISSSVDKILQDALHIITYRALGYLLLGVVRIYSKKVEYLFDDCHKTLIGINDFVVSTKDNADTETMHAPYFSITLPDRFELDAFDLDILEDTGGGNVVPHEAITLKDGVSENLAIRQYSLDMYHCEEIVAAQSTSSANYNLVEDILSSCLMDINMELGTSYNINSSEASIKRLQDNRFSEEECANFEMFYGIEEPLNTVFPNTEGQANGEMIKYSEISPSEDGMQGEASIEKLRDCSLYQEMIEGEPPDHIKPYSEYHKTDQERTIVSQFVTLDNEMFQVVRGDHNQCSLHTEAEKLEDFTHTPEEYIDHNQCRLQTEAEKLEDFTHTPEEYICHAMFCSPKEPQGLVTPFGEENHDDDDGQQISLEITSSANRKCQISMEDHLLSTTPHGILECKVPNTSGSIVPQFMVLPTPAIKERARISRKRKCIIDDMIVLPNEVIRKGIHDASDLVSKRRKVPHTALVAWKSYRIGNLSNCFLEPLVPYVSLELRSLFCQQKLKIIESVKTVGPPAELYVAASPVASRSEQIAIAPETPVQRSTLTKSFGSPGSPEALNYDGVRPEPFETVEKEQPLCRDQQLNFNLCEEIDPCLGDNQKLNGWSGRTRMVARYLDGSFLNQKKQREKEGVNLLPIVVGRTKKESARLFYEILVLKTRGYVDVKQDDAYGDVLIWKLPKWDQISEDDGQ